jgi:molecular chaperone GrpE (heat shock protein)
MEKDDLETLGSQWPILEAVQHADPAERMADDMRMIKRLRDIIQEKRMDSYDSMRKLLLKLLEVDDALDRILAVSPNPECLTEERQWNSIRVTRKLLREAFRLQKVTPIELMGLESDPMLCEIEGHEDRNDLPEDTVIQEIIKGYRWGDDPTPLRTAVVIVSRQSKI